MISGATTTLVIHAQWPGLTVAVDDILKDFEAVDFFHGEHPGVMYSHRKLLIKKSELLTRHIGLRTLAWTFLMSHK